MFEKRIRHRRNVNTETREVELVTETVCWDTEKNEMVAVTDSHTEVIAPGSDLKERDAETAALCRGVWTPDSVQAFDKKFAAQMAASQKMRADMIAAQEAQLAQIEAQKKAVEENMRNLQALVELNNQVATAFEEAQAKMRAQEKSTVQAYREVVASVADAANKFNQAQAEAMAVTQEKVREQQEAAVAAFSKASQLATEAASKMNAAHGEVMAAAQRKQQ